MVDTTDLAIARVGGVARVNAWLKEAGYGNAIRGNYGEADDQIGRFAQHLVECFDK